MEKIESDLHGSFYSEAHKLFSGLSHEKEVFDALWKNDEYRWAWKYLHEEVIPKLPAKPSQEFAELDEQFYHTYIE